MNEENAAICEDETKAEYIVIDKGTLTKEEMLANSIEEKSDADER